MAREDGGITPNLNSGKAKSSGILRQAAFSSGLNSSAQKEEFSHAMVLHIASHLLNL